MAAAMIITDGLLSRLECLQLFSTMNFNNK